MFPSPGQGLSDRVSQDGELPHLLLTPALFQHDAPQEDLSPLVQLLENDHPYSSWLGQASSSNSFATFAPLKQSQAVPTFPLQDSSPTIVSEAAWLASISQEGMTALLESIGDLDTSQRSANLALPNFSFPFDRRQFQSGSQLQSPPGNLQRNVHRASHRRRPMTFAGTSSGEVLETGQPDLTHAQDRWSSFRPRTQSSLSVSSDTDMDLEKDVGSPGTHSSEASLSPSVISQQLTPDSEILRLQLQQQAVGPRFQGCTEEAASESTTNPTLMLSELCISQPDNCNAILHPSTTPGQSFSPSDAAVGPRRRPLRRDHTGGSIAPTASLSARAAMGMRSQNATSSQHSLFSHLALTRRRSPVQSLHGLPSSSSFPGIDPPGQVETSYELNAGGWRRGKSPRGGSQRMQASEDALDDSGMQRGSLSGGTSSYPTDTSRLGSSFDCRSASTAYDSWLFDESITLNQRCNSGVKTPLSSPSASAYDILPEQQSSQPRRSVSQRVSDCPQSSSSLGARATTWPRSRPLSMVSMPTGGSGASYGLSQLDIRNLGLHQASAARPVSTLSQYREAGRRSGHDTSLRARIDTVSGNLPYRGSYVENPADRYDEVRAALETLRRFVAQSQSPSADTSALAGDHSRSASVTHSLSENACPPSASLQAHSSMNPSNRVQRPPPRVPLPPRGQRGQASSSVATRSSSTRATASKDGVAHEERMRVLHDVSELIKDLTKRSDDYIRMHGVALPPPR
ncbi:hypothetical protein K437DRAFT_181173 [Tilletiaria anomala UBC 951]|uniref:Uncharacterized protein n=1 Tax=Tilletiaria anomala (strain ATCC 24038 / CBS 436.72 / UBC 951) TaxID=1037660 RepID=A0A066VQ98_TILAU|nr:uncharacterized protein K437DRAFT_181173 [Tilletiaria anomala UBC 951]KDN40959.1 hypothetical protein K437DRAFT_181173 [Tilletiaria anomala UBC 951]